MADIEGVAEFLVTLEKKALAIQGNLGKAIREAAQVLRSHIRRRVLIPKQVNKQDGPTGQVFTPPRRVVTTVVDEPGLQATIRVSGHWAPANSKVLGAVSTNPLRDALIIQRQLFPDRRQAPEARVSFTHGWMRQWAETHGQVQRRAIFLGAGTESGRERLETSDTDSVRPKVMALLKKAVERGAE